MIHHEQTGTHALRIGTRLWARKYDSASGLWLQTVLLSVNKKFTTLGAAFVVDAFQGLTALSDMRWHGSGTGSAAESNGDTKLQVEVAARFSGTQTEASSTTYRTVGTIVYNGTFNITEHGLFNASTGGILIDRSTFAARPVTTNDRIEFTFDITVQAEA